MAAMGCNVIWSYSHILCTTNLHAAERCGAVPPTCFPFIKQWLGEFVSIHGYLI
jgi:hypothetical protein